MRNMYMWRVNNQLTIEEKVKDINVDRITLK